MSFHCRPGPRISSAPWPTAPAASGRPSLLRLGASDTPRGAEIQKVVDFACWLHRGYGFSLKVDLRVYTYSCACI